VITVMAGKGGSGKTITATNLAAALTERLGEDRVVIVDADLQFGDVALMLQIDPTRTIVDAAAIIDELTEPRLDAILLRHDSGLRVMPAPLVPAGADKIGPKDVVRVVEMLRGMYSFVVVDTAPIFDDGLITLLEHSDDVLLVVDMDLPSVKNAKIALDTLRAIGFDTGKVHLTVNRANSKARLDLAELERALGEKVAASIPSDRLIPQSVNEGVPAVTFSPRSRVAKAFYTLAELFLPR
jgi:pilus assembly protein CpaE